MTPLRPATVTGPAALVRAAGLPMSAVAVAGVMLTGFGLVHVGPATGAVPVPPAGKPVTKPAPPVIPPPPVAPQPPPAAPPPAVPGEKWEVFRLRDGRRIVGRLRTDTDLVVIDGIDRRHILPNVAVTERAAGTDADVPVIIRVSDPPAKRPPTAINPVPGSIRLVREADGLREVALQDVKLGAVTTTIRVVEIGPRLVRWDCDEHVWTLYLPLAGHDPARINRLIAAGVDLGTAANRLLLARFLRQAGLYGDADNQIRLLSADAPADLKPKVDRERLELQWAFARALMREMRAAAARWDLNTIGQLAGRPETDHLSAADLAAWEEIVRQAADASAQTARLSAALKTLRAQIATDPAGVTGMPRTLMAADALIKEGLHPEQALRAAAELATLGGEPADARSRLARLTGVLTVGAGARPTDAARVEMLLATREVLAEHLTTPTADKRFALRRTLATTKGLTGADVAALLATLPPVEAVDDTTEERKPAGRAMKVKAHFTAGNAFYTVRLPSGYHTGRDWPVLVALHPMPGSTADMAGLWAEHADRWGHILICPDHTAGGRPGYANDPGQHAAALNALRDAARRWRIDFNRVRLTGHNEGGECAWGTALYRPDAWAAVAVFSGAPENQAGDALPNLGNVPVLVVEGDRRGHGSLRSVEFAGKAAVLGHDVHFQWLPGRGAEAFREELDDVMDFLSRRTRDPFPAKLEVWSHRRADSVFAWVEMKSVTTPAGKIDVPNAQMTEESWAGLDARREGNDIRIREVRVSEVRVFLCPGMIDADRHVTIRINDRTVFQEKVIPNLERMLAAYLRMPDRARVCWNVLDLRSPR